MVHAQTLDNVPAAALPVFANNQQLMCSVAVLAEILLRSPRKIVIFIIKKYVLRIEVSKK